MRDRPQLKLCNCNGTMSIDAKQLASAIGVPAPLRIHSQLCKKELPAFQAALDANEDCLVACTQEAPLFAEVAAERASSLKFFNIRETAGWSAESAHSTPKIAALIALAQLPEPEPVPVVSYQSNGRALIVGPAAAALPWAEKLATQLQVSVLSTDARGAEMPAQRRYPVWSGRLRALKGHLGAFQASWTQENPIDLERCTRCKACVDACPESAIDLAYQIDMERCTGHRDCVKACGAIGAIDFNRLNVARTEDFDLVLDLNREAAIRVAHKPQGYFRPGDDPLDQALAAMEMLQMVGEFEKPKFFEYDAKICAHGRSKKSGCSNCIDVCSTGAIRSAGDKIEVDPHLCAGCGACSAVCPSGAMRYAYPRMDETGLRMKTLLNVYRQAGGERPALLMHNAEGGRTAIETLARRGKGLPARVLPMEKFHIASIGLDTLLGAVAYGAREVFLLATAEERAEYGAPLQAQIMLAETILQGLGYAGSHFALLSTEDPAAMEARLWSIADTQSVAEPASFQLSQDKRGTLQMIFDHLLRHAPTPQKEIPLATGSPFGAVQVDQNKCTLCMACVSACPSSALVDGRDMPALKFIERNCLQCNLCAQTCPENALSLLPRLSLAPEARKEVQLHGADPFHCLRCGTAFGTKQIVDTMLKRLGSHSMFANEAALRRLQMCPDCRVLDMMENDPGMLVR